MTPSRNLAAASVLVRGATGFLGGALAKGLLGSCGALRLFCRRPERLDPVWRAAAVEIVAGDASDPEAVARSLRGVDLVIDAIGATVPAIAPGELLPEVECTLRPLAVLLDAMRTVPDARLLFLSSGGAVYGAASQEAWTEESAPAPESAYGLGKLLSEEMIRFRSRRDGTSYCIVRAANVYGRERMGTLPQGVVDIFLDRAARGEPLERWGDGTQVRDYLFIDDFVSAVRALLDLPPGNDVVQIGTGIASDLDDVVAAVEAALGPARTRSAEESGLHPGVRRSVLRAEKLRASTGWEPRFTLAAGVAEAARRRALRTPPGGEGPA